MHRIGNYTAIFGAGDPTVLLEASTWNRIWGVGLDALTRISLIRRTGGGRTCLARR